MFGICAQFKSSVFAESYAGQWTCWTLHRYYKYKYYMKYQDITCFFSIREKQGFENLSAAVDRVEPKEGRRHYYRENRDSVEV